MAPTRRKCQFLDERFARNWKFLLFHLDTTKSTESTPDADVSHAAAIVVVVDVDVVVVVATQTTAPHQADSSQFQQDS